MIWNFQEARAYMRIIPKGWWGRGCAEAFEQAGVDLGAEQPGGQKRLEANSEANRAAHACPSRPRAADVTTTRARARCWKLRWAACDHSGDHCAGGPPPVSVVRLDGRPFIKGFGCKNMLTRLRFSGSAGRFRRA